MFSQGSEGSSPFIRTISSAQVPMTTIKLTAVFMKTPEGYVGFVEELPGANTQGETLEEARDNLNEAVALVLEANRTIAEESIGQAEVIRESFVLPAV